MRITNLTDNALFIRNWRERMRLPYIISFGVIVGLVITLIFLGYYLTYESQRNLEALFFSLAVLQGLILILAGIHAANKMAFKEKLGGTLDLHRCSPTSSFNQMIGIILGAPSLEWIVFFGTLPVSFCVALASDISLFVFCNFYIGLALCALFFHSVAVLIALSSDQKKGSISPLTILFLFVFFIPFAQGIGSSAAYHMSWFPAYEYLNSEVTRVYVEKFPQLHEFFGHVLPFPLLQIIVQLPLLILACAGIKRRVEHSEKPLFSKLQSLFLSLLALIFYAGSTFLHLSGDKGTWRDYHYQHGFAVGTFLYLIFLLGIFSAIIVTPKLLSYSKGLRRMKKLGLKRMSVRDDHNTSAWWLIGFCLVAAGAYYLAFYSKISAAPATKILCFIVIMTQVIFFCSALECFSLSRFHKKKVFFWTAIGVLWLIVPLFGIVTQPLASSRAYLEYFYSPSPFFGTVFLIEKLVSETSVALKHFFIFSLILNSVLAIGMAITAFRMRCRVREKIEADFRASSNYPSSSLPLHFSNSP